MQKELMMKYSIETGLFRNEKFAKSQKEMLLRKGYDSIIVKIKKDRKWYFSVRTGLFDSNEQASDRVEMLKKNERLRGKIVKSED